MYFEKVLAFRGSFGGHDSSMVSRFGPLDALLVVCLRPFFCIPQAELAPLQIGNLLVVFLTDSAILPKCGMHSSLLVFQ